MTYSPKNLLSIVTLLLAGGSSVTAVIGISPNKQLSSSQSESLEEVATTKLNSDTLNTLENSEFQRSADYDGEQIKKLCEYWEGEKFIRNEKQDCIKNSNSSHRLTK